MIPLIQRQVAWVQAAFGFYPHPLKQVQPFQERDWGGYRDRSFPEERVREILKVFLSRDPALSVWHQSRHRTTYRLEADSERKVSVFLKHYRCRALSLYNPRSYLRLGHARKAFRLSYLIAKMSIPTAQVLFCLRESRAGFRSDALLVTQEVPESMDLKSWMRDRYPKLDRYERALFAKELARFLVRLHQNGICHGDFESNTLVVPEPYRFYLIDLDSIRTFGAMLMRDRRKQLNTLVRRLQKIRVEEEFFHLLRQTYFAQLGINPGTQHP